MITPSFALTATERVLPNMALDFTTAALDSRVTFTRSGNTATVTNSSGVIAAINADLPRFDFNPTTLACRGLLIEETRTNLLLNSLLDGTSLATQLITTTAVAHTLSFYGTGQIVLTGTSSATVVGTGAYPARQTLTFTPTAGVLTLTVTGTVQYAQLEVGAFATSFIPTAATAITRNADVATMTGTNFTSWYNASEGSFLVQAQQIAPFSATAVFTTIEVSDGTTSNFLQIGTQFGANNFQTIINSGGGNQATFLTTASTNLNKRVAGYKVNNFLNSVDGAATSSDNSGVVPVSINVLGIGSSRNGRFLNGTIRQVAYYKQCLISNEVQAFSK